MTFDANSNAEHSFLLVWLIEYLELNLKLSHAIYLQNLCEAVNLPIFRDPGNKNPLVQWQTYPIHKNLLSKHPSNPVDYPH